MSEDDPRERVRHQRRTQRKPFPRPRLTPERVEALDYALTQLQDTFDVMTAEDAEVPPYPEDQQKKMADAMVYLSELIAYKRSRASGTA